MSILGHAMMSVGGYREDIGECSVHQGFHTNSIVLSTTFPKLICVSLGVFMIFLHCSKHPQVYS